MSNKPSSIENLSAEELGKQLKKPHGQLAIDIANSMNQVNKELCLNAYKLLHAKNGDTIMELGMCNGYFVKNLLETARDISYHGVDYSRDMVNEAKRINNKEIQTGQVSFTNASVEQLPFPDKTFDKIISINSIYFWPDTKNNIAELYRVLKDNGELLIAYRSKEYLDQVDLANQSFKKFHPNDIQDLFEQNGFKKVLTQVMKESKSEFRGQTFEKLGYFTKGYKH